MLECVFGFTKMKFPEAGSDLTDLTEFHLPRVHVGQQMLLLFEQKLFAGKPESVFVLIVKRAG